MPAGDGERSGIGVDTSASRGETALEIALKIWLAKPKLEAELKKRYTQHPFTHVHFHRVKAIDVVLSQYSPFEEVQTVTVQHSSVFPPGEVQFAIRLGNEYLVVDWDYAMEEEELRQKQTQNRDWKWRRGAFVKPH